LRADLPDTHVADAFELSPDALVDLFRIQLNQLGGSTIICMTAQKQVVWQGMTFESIAVNLTQEGVSTNGEWQRPKFTVANPDGVFSAFVAQGKMDAATITRYRVNKADVDANIGRFAMNVWRQSKTLSMSRTLVTFELRSPLDGPQFQLPARAFYPPEYPHVSL
jgi:lambda family phage minor tail protein L